MPVVEQPLRIAAWSCLAKPIQHGRVRCTKEACNGSMSTDTQVVVVVETGKVVVDGCIRQRVARIVGMANAYRESENRFTNLNKFYRRPYGHKASIPRSSC